MQDALILGWTMLFSVNILNRNEVS